MLFLDGRVVVNHGLNMLKYLLLVWVSKRVWLIGMTCLIMHYTFKRVKWLFFTRCPFLACFALICENGLILSLCGVLTPFSPLFQNILGSSRWRFIWNDLKKAWIFSIIQVGRYSLSEGDANIFLRKLVCFLRLLCSFHFHLGTTCIRLFVASLHLI